MSIFRTRSTDQPETLPQPSPQLYALINIRHSPYLSQAHMFTAPIDFYLSLKVYS
jgi:hypothetical protein